ncbi:MAG: DUF5605 domain-containing protein [Lachnospiraceae bacterium]|nr:DUF5605 domain-containing protein [Lachnospiraceae bacterium]
MNGKKLVEKWCVFEVAFSGRKDGNPFVDYAIQGEFTGANEKKCVDGFYDGEGIYKVRFMPSFEGDYHYKVWGTFAEEEVYEGDFTVTPAREGNHGPVHVANTYHFAYEDGTPYYSIGTTCYVWALQSLELQEQTLETLKNSAFNKIRFCIFPKHYDYNLKEPYSYPYEGTPMDSSVLTSDNFMQYNGCAPGNDWDYTRFNPDHFAHLERRIQDLCDLGIEADLIVMHPYDRWGFSTMTKEQDDLYWNYVISRFSAFRNVWWSLANEYDLMPQKTLEDWERCASIVCEKDVYGHLRSIHNCKKIYDFKRPWITHCSLQRTDPYLSGERVTEWRNIYGKPVVLDEIVYEGNIQHNWGNITGEEMTRRFWEAAVRGGYPGHGETYYSEDQILWWSHGGVLKGSSPERFHFLLRILKEIPGHGLKQIEEDFIRFREDTTGTVDSPLPVPYYICYYGYRCPVFKEYMLDPEKEYEVEIIDTWNMTITKCETTFRGKISVELPGREYMALRIYEKGLLK